MPKNCIIVALKRMHAQYFGLWAQYIMAKAHNVLNIGLWAQYIVAKALCYKLPLCVCVWVQYIVAKALCYKIFSARSVCGAVCVCLGAIDCGQSVVL